MRRLRIAAAIVSNVGGLMLENVTTSVVYGFADGTIYVSARARSTEIDLGETLRDAFGKIGSAGGHVDMAGAQITMGVLEATDEREESLEQIVESVVADRFLEAADTYLTEGPARVYTPETAEEYLEPGADIDRREPPAEEGEGIGPGRALSDDGEIEGNATAGPGRRSETFFRLPVLGEDNGGRGEADSPGLHDA